MIASYDEKLKIFIQERRKKMEELRAKAEKERYAKRKETLKARRSKAAKKEKATRNKTYAQLQGELKASFQAAEDLIAEEEKAGNYVPGDTTEEEDEDDE